MWNENHEGVDLFPCHEHEIKCSGFVTFEGFTYYLVSIHNADNITKSIIDVRPMHVHMRLMVASIGMIVE